MDFAFNWSNHLLFLEQLLGASFCDYARPIHIIKFTALQQKLVLGNKNLNLKIFDILFKMTCEIKVFFIDVIIPILVV